MMRSSIVALSGLLGVATALDTRSLLSGLGPAPEGDPRFTDWQAPGPDDLRSPCPGLNTLANHGFIHRDGRDMTIPHLVTGLANGLNMGADFTVAIGAVALLSAPNPLGGSFDLPDIDQHNFFIEHDASMSRQDAYFGNDYSFYDPNWQEYLSHFGSNKTTDLKTVSAAKYSRYEDSLQRNPTFTYGARETVLSYGENSLYVQTLGDPYSGVTNLDYARMFFEQEKLPYELGWRPSTEPVTLMTLGQMVVELYLMSPSPVNETFTVTSDSYKDIFELIAGGQNVLNNLTDGLASQVGL